MIGVLVRLKINLLRAGLRTGGMAGTITFGWAVATAVLVGASAGFSLVFARISPAQYRDDVIVTTATLLMVLWVIGPVLAAAVDGTLEVDKLAQFPLTANQLVPGLLAASVVGTGGLATLLALAGLAIGVVPASPLALVVLAALAVLLLQCVALSRLATTALSGVAKKRRWRDLAVLVVPVLVISINVGFQVFANAAATRGDLVRWPSAVVQVVLWMPSGLSARAVIAADHGRVLGSMGWLMASVAALGALLMAWGWATQRVLTSASSTAPGARASRSGGRTLPLFGGVLGAVPRTRAGVVAAKELRLQWRDPRQRVALIMPLVGLAGPALGGFLAGNPDPRTVLFCAVPALLLGSSAMNLYGFDGFAHWVNVAAGDDARSDILGKVGAKAVTALVASLVMAVVLAARAGSPASVAAGMALSVCTLGICLGMGLPYSVKNPVPIPDTPGNLYSSGNIGANMAQFGPALIVMFGSLALTAPFGIAALVLFDNPFALGVVSLAAVGTGMAAGGLGVRASIRMSADRQPELLARLGRPASA